MNAYCVLGCVSPGNKAVKEIDAIPLIFQKWTEKAMDLAITGRLKPLYCFCPASPDRILHLQAVFLISVSQAWVLTTSYFDQERSF